MTAWSQLKLFVVAVAAAVVAVSAVFVVGDHFRKGNRRRKKNMKNKVLGLYNLGNTCFANALLQSLAACPTFELWLSNVDGSISARNYSFLIELNRIVSYLNHPSEDGPVAADGVLAALRAHRWVITPDIEQDLFELFNVFVTTWDEELIPICESKSFTLADVGGLAEISSSKNRHGELLHNISEMVRVQHQYRAPCAGLMGIELHCRICDKKTVRHDRFCSLDLVLPKTTSFTEISVESCLRKYFAQELLLNYKCEHCQSNGNASSSLNRSSVFKKQGFSKLPDCLVLRINRVGMLPNGQPFKHIDHVNFSDVLCVNDFLFYREAAQTRKSVNGSGDWSIRGGSDRDKSAISIKQPRVSDSVTGDQFNAGDSLMKSIHADLGYYQIANPNRYVYNLKAVVVHTGNPDSGHFVTYRRGWSPGIGGSRNAAWFYTSDAEVKKVSFGNVASREAYMLFYERALVV